MKLKSIERFSDAQIKKLNADLSKNNEDITETAGFVPLEVKLKRFEESGMLMQFNNQEFTSNDYREAYLSPDYAITPEDELEDINEKLAAREEFLANIKKQRSDIVEKITPITKKEEVVQKEEQPNQEE